MLERHGTTALLALLVTLAGVVTGCATSPQAPEPASKQQENGPVILIGEDHPQYSLAPEPPPKEVLQSWNAPRIWPVEHPERELISFFGPRGRSRSRRVAFHKGLDIRAPFRTPVVATADGTVSFSGGMRGYGNYIRIDHGEGIESGYGHMTTRSVKTGDYVRRGDTLGLMGATGNATTIHVHYEVCVNGDYLDPLFFIPAE